MKNLFILVHIIYTKIKIVQLNEAEIEKPYRWGLTKLNVLSMETFNWQEVCNLQMSFTFLPQILYD